MSSNLTGLPERKANVLPVLNPVVVVTSVEGFDLLQDTVRENAGPIGFDTELSGRVITWKNRTWLDWYSCELTGFSLSVGSDNWYVPVRHADGPNIHPLLAQNLLRWIVSLFPSRRVWAHNAKIELQVLQNEGIVVPWDVRQHLLCSQVAAWLAGWGSDHKSLKLKKLAAEHGYGSGNTFEDVARKRQSKDVPVAEMAPYAGRDAWLTAELGTVAYRLLEAHGLVDHFHKIDMPLVEIVRSIEEWGTPVDAPRVREQSDRLSAEATKLAADFEFLTTTTILLPAKERQPTGEFFKNGNPKLKTVEVLRPFVIGCKIGNDHQVSRWLYDELRLWPTDGLKLNGAHHWPTDKETLETFTTLPGLAGELAQMRLDWAWRDKLVKTYLRPLLEMPPQYADGLLHTSLNLTGTSTQRFSSSNPNLQNVPSRTEEGRAIRTALRARPGWVYIIFDYSQIELRIMAHLSRDPEMMACYWLDIDIHQGTLEEMRRTWADAQRVNAKTTNFSTIYRISPPSLAVKMRVPVPAAEASIEAFYNRFRNVSDYHEAAIAYAGAHGYARTIDGFKRFLEVEPKYNFRTRRKEMPWHVANEAVNTPIQGSAAGLAKIAMIRMWNRWQTAGVYGNRVVLAGQEHDAIITEAREDYVDQAFADMKSDMESAMELRVPIIAEGGTGPSWGEAKH